MTIRLCVVFNSSTNRNLKSSNVTERVRELAIRWALCTYCQRRHAADKLEFDRMEGMVGYLYCIRYAEGVMPVRFLNWRQK
jgi:hypothetical protein